MIWRRFSANRNPERRQIQKSNHVALCKSSLNEHKTYARSHAPATKWAHKHNIRLRQICPLLSQLALWFEPQNTDADNVGCVTLTEESQDSRSQV